MAMVDTKEWKEFKLIGPDGLFKSYERGKISVARELSDGHIPYVGAVFPDRNNGIVKYVKPAHGEQITKGNCIVMVCDGAAIGCNMYQESDFVGTVNLKIIRSDFMNRKIGLFLCAALNRSAVRCGYSYFQKRNDEALSKEVISLPATPDGHPDWAYMDAYMGEVLKKEEVFAEHLASLTAEAVVDGHQLDTSGWKAFRIEELFEILLAKGDIQPKQVADGMIPLVSAGNEDNGIVAFIDEAGDGVSEIFPAGCITVSMFGKAFYQPERFYAVSHGRINILQPKVEFSSIVGTFLTACLSRVLESKYDYATMCTQKKLATESISLPVTVDGTPDWAWMEQYMQRQMDKAAALVEHLDAVFNDR